MRLCSSGCKTSWPNSPSLVPSSTVPIDPFLVHAMITHDAFRDAKAATTESRYKLYDQLDLFDPYSHNPADRNKLEEVTIALHTVSQQTDVLLASADMASMIAEKLLLGHQRYESFIVDPSLKNGMAETDGALSYLQSSMESQKRWLNSYRVRKDIAMNLVYNLVIQKDSYVDTTITQDTNSDSRSMRIIAAPTMKFLPGTFLASVFGTNFANEAKVVAVHRDHHTPNSHHPFGLVAMGTGSESYRKASWC